MYSVNIGGISPKRVAIYGAINFGAINLLLKKMEQFYGAIIWYHLMAPFYGMCVPGFTNLCYQMLLLSSSRNSLANELLYSRTDIAVCGIGVII